MTRCGLAGMMGGEPALVGLGAGCPSCGEWRLRESSMMRCCFDKRVWIGLGVLAAGLLIVDPRAGWVALPVFAGLACPVSMLVMMRGMRHPAGPPEAAAPGGGQVAGTRDAAWDRAAEIA